MNAMIYDCMLRNDGNAYPSRSPNCASCELYTTAADAMQAIALSKRLVRCKDCIHYSNDEIGWCDFHSHFEDDGSWFEPDEDDFCSCAETEADKLNICGDVDCEGCILQHHGTIEQCREEAKRRKNDATN